MLFSNLLKQNGREDNLPIFAFPPPLYKPRTKNRARELTAKRAYTSHYTRTLCTLFVNKQSLGGVYFIFPFDPEL